ncbi:MAG TPA: hypothetical protein VFX86_04610 [Candidatus Saccharimonadales bacterium]|nr:hypothetical protein [Candidatus Saccharimonadales bacterium]
MSNSGKEFSRVSIELPSRDAEAATRLLQGLGEGRNLDMQPVPAPEYTMLPAKLYTMLEDPSIERLVPAVQRPHLRTFESETEWAGTGVAERFVSGLWVRGPSAAKRPKDRQWYDMRHAVIFDRGGRVSALRAEKTESLRQMIEQGRVDLMGVGLMTLAWFGEFSQAVRAQLDEANSTTETERSS